MLKKPREFVLLCETLGIIRIFHSKSFYIIDQQKFTLGVIFSIII